MSSVKGRKTAAVLAVVVILTSLLTVSSGADKLADTVKVGLYYKGSSVNTAQSLFDVSAQAGLMIGFFQNGNFVEIYTEASSSPLYIRKDSFYYDTGSGLKEIDPSGSKVTGTKYGPYHIKIGSDCPDAATAADQAAYYRQLGIDAFIAYNDAWQVWTGLCTDETRAKELIGTLIPVLGEAGYEIIQPSLDRIVVINGQYSTMCIFGSKAADFQIRPAPGNDPPVLKIKGKQYRGAIEVKRLSNSDMTVINVVSIRDYLYGNVPPEIGGRSPAEALKAQAVASKMYALNNKGKHGATGFDICDTTHCQVYKGYSVELPGCNSAIDEVYDKTITYNGSQVKHVYYFASGGGSTEDVRNVWGSSYPYLVSVEDKYEKIYTWTKTLRASDVKSKLPQLGNILGITITRTAPTGRVTQLAVTGASRGEPAYYSNEKCRTLFGLDSQLYTITSDADVFISGLSDKPATNVGAQISDTESEKIVDALEETPADPDPAVIKDADGSADTQSASRGETSEPAAPPEKPKAPAVLVPEISEPVRTQLGGKKVITADGVQSVKGTNNKITVLGADGVVNKATVVPETYVFTGKGWGHAVGMSQEGAIGMAKAGLSYEDILTHYFQGTKVE
ncbi:MAG: SpoIID/LytB domain-containing protein [Clostridiaceae bacterium]|nr:SpoIID/LytB domain-containing protein [Clostridiaceae bacterium]